MLSPNTFPTVTVAVSAYNEASNIADFLASVLSQQEDGYALENIWVFLDGCTDNTAQVVRRFSSPYISIIEDGMRTGKSQRLNQIYNAVESDILIQSDADVIWSHPGVITAMVSALQARTAVKMAGGRPTALPATTFTERAINLTASAYDSFRDSVRGGHNVFSADGRILGYKKEFLKKITVPKTMIANDAFTYYSCKQLGYEYAHVPEAVVWYRSPKTIRDHIRQNTRFVATPARMVQYFPEELVKEETAVPIKTKVIAFGRQFVQHPIACLYIACINTYCRLNAWINRKNLTAIWSIAISTKSLHNEKNST